MYNNDQNSESWWLVKDDVNQAIFRHLVSLENFQTYVAQNNIRHLKLYGSGDSLRMDTLSSFQRTDVQSTSPRVTLNIVSPMVDTVVSKICKNVPKPQFLTDGGDFSMQLKAQNLTKFIDGLFYGMKLKEAMVKSFRSSAIFGTGAVYFFIEDGEIKCENVHINEIKVDDQETMFTAPRTIHRARFIAADVLKTLFPKYKEEIDTANKTDLDLSVDRGDMPKNMVYVIESWHLGNGEKFDGGRHTITISNSVLFDEDYKKKYLPFVFHRWMDLPVGFWGKGIAEILAGTQLEINKILRTIQVAMHLVCIPKVLIDVNSKIVSAHLDTRIGGLIKHAGKEPSFQNMGTVSPELFKHLDWLYQRSFEEVGLSQLSAQSKLPAGLEAAVAMREYNNIESERFMDVGVRWEQSWMDSTEICTDLARDLYEEKGKLNVRVAGKTFIETIDWKHVNLDNDKYILKCFPIASLSTTPAARKEEVTELIQAGLISKEDGLELLDFPDVKADTNLYVAAKKNIMWTIDEMIHKGYYLPPEPYQNLQLGVQLMQQSYLLYKTQNAPDERLDLLRNWINDAQALMQSSAPQIPPGPVMGSAAAATNGPIDPTQSAPVTGAPQPPQANSLIPQ